MKANIMVRKKGCRNFKWRGLATATSTWLYDWSRYAERGDGDVIVVDAKNAAAAKKAARDILDGRLRPHMRMGWGDVKTCLYVHGQLAVKCFIGAKASLQVWDYKGTITNQELKPLVMHDRLMRVLEMQAAKIAPKVYIEGNEVLN